MKRLLAVLGLLIAFGAHAETWNFALIGDTPYSDYERRELPLMMHAIAEEHPSFIAHAGDIKSSQSKCSNAVFLDRHALFNASTVPFIFTPGDNEWTDCKHLVSDHFDELERLGKLRELFFAEARSLGTTRIPVEQQSVAYPEHLRWRLGPVLFVTLNVPGPNNNFGMRQEARPEFLARNPNVIDWLKQGFSCARGEKSAGIVIVMQGNPGFQHFAAGLAHSGYRELLQVLRQGNTRLPRPGASGAWRHALATHRPSPAPPGNKKADCQLHAGGNLWPSLHGLGQSHHRQRSTDTFSLRNTRTQTELSYTQNQQKNAATAAFFWSPTPISRRGRNRHRECARARFPRHWPDAPQSPYK